MNKIIFSTALKKGDNSYQPLYMYSSNTGTKSVKVMMREGESEVWLCKIGKAI